MARSDARSLRWREDFIRTYLERDIAQFGPRIPAETLRRLWTMLAHHQGGLLNMTQLARNLGVDVKTVGGYVDLLCDLLLLRRLQPWQTNLGKRLVKAPKVYVRDSGLLHALLNIGSVDALLSHMVVGASWEGYGMRPCWLAHHGAPPGISTAPAPGRRWICCCCAAIACRPSCLRRTRARSTRGCVSAAA
jgi:predicted AAA+ superfamily ATPase